MSISSYNSSSGSKPQCSLVNRKRDVFALLFLVARTLGQAGLHKQADEFLRRAVAHPTYDELVAIAREFVEIEEEAPA